jgi:hypothetical protein
MSGLDLATARCMDPPELKVLLHQVSTEAWHFPAKPFIASQFRTLIRGLILATAGKRLSEAPLAGVQGCAPKAAIAASRSFARAWILRHSVGFSMRP